MYVRGDCTKTKDRLLDFGMATGDAAIQFHMGEAGGLDDHLAGNCGARH